MTLTMTMTVECYKQKIQCSCLLINEITTHLLSLFQMGKMSSLYQLGHFKEAAVLFTCQLSNSTYSQ